MNQERLQTRLDIDAVVLTLFGMEFQREANENERLSCVSLLCACRLSRGMMCGLEGMLQEWAGFL